MRFHEFLFIDFGIAEVDKNQTSWDLFHMSLVLEQLINPFDDWASNLIVI